MYTGSRVTVWSRWSVDRSQTRALTELTEKLGLHVFWLLTS